MSKYRADQAAKGLVEVRVWVPINDAEFIRESASLLRSAKKMETDLAEIESAKRRINR